MNVLPSVQQPESIRLVITVAVAADAVFMLLELSEWQNTLARKHSSVFRGRGRPSRTCAAICCAFACVCDTRARVAALTPAASRNREPGKLEYIYIFASQGSLSSAEREKHSFVVLRTILRRFC